MSGQENFFVLIHIYTVSLFFSAISGLMPQSSQHLKYIFQKSTLFHVFCVIIVSWGQLCNIFEQLIWKLIPVISSPPFLPPFAVCRFKRYLHQFSGRTTLATVIAPNYKSSTLCHKCNVLEEIAAYMINMFQNMQTSSCCRE